MKKKAIAMFAAFFLAGILVGCAGTDGIENGRSEKNGSDSTIENPASSDELTDDGEIASGETDISSRMRLTEAEGIDLSQFELTDTDGNTITQDIFEDYDVTIINCWTTWCPYCIAEMPYLNEYYSELSEAVNLIGICMDAYEEPDDFKELTEQLNLDFTVLAGTEAFYHTMGGNNMAGYPTTYFVDRNGSIIGQKIGTPVTDGNHFETVTDGYRMLLQDALEKIHE